MNTDGSGGEEEDRGKDFSAPPRRNTFSSVPIRGSSFGFRVEFMGQGEAVREAAALQETEMRPQHHFHPRSQPCRREAAGLCAHRTVTKAL